MKHLGDYRAMDPDLLYSLLNTWLRNDYRDLDDLARGLGLERGPLEAHLVHHGFAYDAGLRQFRSRGGVVP